MEYIFRTFVSGVIVYVMTELLKRILFPEFPKDKEFDIMQKKYDLYKKLYYLLCTDFSTGSLFSFEKEPMALSRRLEMFYKFSYLRNSEISEMLSNKLQKEIRIFINHPNKKTFNKIQRRVRSEFYSICKVMKYDFYYPKSHFLLFECVFLFFAFASIILSFMSMYFVNTHTPLLLFAFLLLPRLRHIFLIIFTYKRA